jgi:hypothetical protein
MVLDCYAHVTPESEGNLAWSEQSTPWRNPETPETRGRKPGGLVRVLLADTPFHVTHRGNARQLVFESDSGRLVYLGGNSVTVYETPNSKSAREPELGGRCTPPKAGRRSKLPGQESNQVSGFRSTLSRDIPAKQPTILIMARLAHA